MGLARRPRRTSYLATPARHGTEYAQPPPTRGSRQPPRPAKRHPGLTATRQQPRKARVPIPTMKSVQTVAPGKIEVSETGRPVPGPETCCCGSAPAASAAHTAPSADGRQAAGPRKADDPDSPGMSRRRGRRDRSGGHQAEAPRPGRHQPAGRAIGQLVKAIHVLQTAKSDDERAQWTAHLERLTTTLRDAGHDPVVLRALELNHCSTTRDSNAAGAANRSLRPTASDLAKRGQESRRPAQGAVIPGRPFCYGHIARDLHI